MRIDHIRLTNFRAFAQAEFSFPRDLDAPPGNGSFHVLIGRNGTGKTSILEALAVAASGWFQGLKAEDYRHIESSDVRLETFQFGEERRSELQYPVEIEADGTAAGQKLVWRRGLAAKGRRTTTKGARDLQALAAAVGTAVRSGAPESLPLISYYGTGRLWLEPHTRESKRLVKRSGTSGPRATKEPLPVYSEQFQSRLAGYRYSVDPRCSPSDLIDWLHFEAMLKVQNGEESHQARIVREAISQSFDTCDGVDFDLKLGVLRLEVRDHGSLPFSMLSDGQRNLAALIGDIAWKAAQLNPHLGGDILKKTPGLVLIDELDLHLHPEWQRQVVETLRNMFPEIQFICTTHSPFVVQSVREGELISLDSQAVPKTENLGVEEISRGLMGVKRPEVARRYREMVDVAKNYLVTLDEAEKAPAEKLADFERRLAAAKAPYADNPAFQAFLELKHESKLGQKADRSSRQQANGAEG